jgi:Bacterial sugar transferase
LCAAARPRESGPAVPERDSRASKFGQFAVFLLYFQREAGGRHVFGWATSPLPRDQPSDPSVRLMSRPGITGWAQVNGGTLLGPSEKDELDEWYVRHASLLLDLRIIMMTLRVLIRGQSRPDGAAANARSTRNPSTEPSVQAAQSTIKAKIDRTGERAGAAAAV